MSEIPDHPHQLPRAKPKRPRLWPVVAATAVAAGLVGGGIGGAVTAASTEPEVRTVTPPECIEALDLAGGVMTVLSEVAKVSSDGARAAYSRNGAELDRVTAMTEELNAKLEEQTAPLGDAASTCRASAK